MAEGVVEEAVAVVEVTEVRDQNEPAAGAGPVAGHTLCASLWAQGVCNFPRILHTLSAKNGLQVHYGRPDTHSKWWGQDSKSLLFSGGKRTL